MIAWISYNGLQTFLFYHDHGSKPFDIYPFILLNLVFSTQAAYAAPLILLAQTRQAERDRIQSEDDRSRNERNIADTEYLAREVASLRIALGDVAPATSFAANCSACSKTSTSEESPATNSATPSSESGSIQTSTMAVLPITMMP